MNVKIITITGADDRVDPEALYHLSVKYPFVEWGILRSQSRLGTPRYPSNEWCDNLARAAPEGMNLAVHLCGEWARGSAEFLCGDTLAVPSPLQDALTMRSRLQLNGIDLPISSLMRHRRPAAAPPSASPWPTPPPIIVQARSRERFLQYMVETTGRLECHVLFDPSGGRGIDCMSAMRGACGDPIRYSLCIWGLAGGIGPHNVKEVIKLANAPVIGPSWIDMESGVRTDDALDLDKVEQVLKQFAPMPFDSRQVQAAIDR